MPPTREPVKKTGHDHAGNKFGPKTISTRLNKGEREALRMAAELYYTLDLDGVTVGDMAAMPKFSGIGKSTLSAWAKSGDWDVKRQDHRLRWGEELKRRLSDQLVHFRHQEFMQLKQIHDQAFLYVCGGEEGHRPAPPRNFVDAAKVYVQLDQVLASRRGELFDHVGIAASGVGQGQTANQSQASLNAPGDALSQGMPIPQMTDDEYQELGHQLLARNFSEAKKQS